MLVFLLLCLLAKADWVAEIHQPGFWALQILDVCINSIENDRESSRIYVSHGTYFEKCVHMGYGCNNLYKCERSEILENQRIITELPKNIGYVKAMEDYDCDRHKDFLFLTIYLKGCFQSGQTYYSLIQENNKIVQKFFKDDQCLTPANQQPETAFVSDDCDVCKTGRKYYCREYTGGTGNEHEGSDNTPFAPDFDGSGHGPNNGGDDITPKPPVKGDFLYKENAIPGVVSIQTLNICINEQNGERQTSRIYVPQDTYYEMQVHNGFGCKNLVRTTNKTLQTGQSIVTEVPASVGYMKNTESVTDCSTHPDHTSVTAYLVGCFQNGLRSYSFGIHDNKIVQTFYKDSICKVVNEDQPQEALVSDQCYQCKEGAKFYCHPFIGHGHDDAPEQDNKPNGDKQNSDDGSSSTLILIVLCFIFFLF